MIVIVDYGMGNLGSIANMCKKIGVGATVTADSGAILAAEKLILPGVGAFDEGMRNLAERGLVPVLGDKVLQQKTPVLGICLGMQLMTRGSEEGSRAGLGWVPARTVRLRVNGSGLKVPHMGWNAVQPSAGSALFRDLPSPPRFYFVHSFHVTCDSVSDVAATVTHGHEFPAAFEHGHIYGVQFHPEKSHRFGMALLQRFAEL
jgi:glutamine amidotransferase